MRLSASISNASRAIALATLLAIGLRAAGAAINETPGGWILTAGDRRVLILSPADEAVWQYPTKLKQCFWMLRRRKVQFADGKTVTKAVPERKVARIFSALKADAPMMPVGLVSFRASRHLTQACADHSNFSKVNLIPKPNE